AQNCPKMKRLALGSTIRLIVEDRIAGYKQLSAYLPFAIDGDQSSDFLYQINRKRQSSVVPSLTINRLTQWSVAALTRLTGQLTIGTSGLLPDMRKYDSKSACQATLDINTDPEYQACFEKNQVKDLFNEFVELALEIGTRGDCP